MLFNYVGSLVTFYRQKAGLSNEEMEKLSQAVEMWAFSRSLYTFLNIPSDILPTHGRTYFIEMFPFDYISIVNEDFAKNFVKLSRNLLRTLLSLFTKSLQDVYRAAYDFCEICNDKE